MRQSFQDSEQRLLLASASLLNQLAEVQKLKEAIQSAEASRRNPQPSAGRQSCLRTEGHRALQGR
jgi:hypothetical protein